MSLIFVGAGGSGVSALVQLMIDLSFSDIICIDSVNSSHMDSFHQAGVKTIIGHDKYTPTIGDLVIYSAATATSSEVVTARENMFLHPLSSPPMLYAEFLGELSKYLFTIAVSGTHGKSTTTGMLAVACVEHLPETTLAIVGAGVTERQGKHCRYNKEHETELHNIVLRIISRKATSLQIPQKKLVFVIEADEFNHHFLFLEPDISIITSLDHDHVDIYPTRESYLEAFEQFCRNTTHRIITLPSVAAQLSNQGEKIYTPEIATFTFSHLVGGHNHSNATLALYACDFTIKIFKQVSEGQTIKKSIEQFQGLKRRVELLGTNKNSIPVFSDYGHHPDEIVSTLHAFREKYPNIDITCFFEAHQARRLITFWEQFINAFKNTRCIVVPPYTAREDIATIQAYRKKIISKNSLPNQIDSFSDLGRAFSEEVGGALLEDWSGLQIALDVVSKGAVLCFSAGVLDSKARLAVST